MTPVVVGIWVHWQTLSPFRCELNANRSAAGNHGDFFNTQTFHKQGLYNRTAEFSPSAGSVVKVEL